MWCVLWLLREGHKRWNHTSHNGDVGNNIDVLNIWNCLHSEDSNWRWHPAYIELRFSFTNGLVFNMSIHWAHVLRFHMCIRSPWFNCAFVSILPFNVCCDNLLIHSSSLPHLFDQGLVKSLTVQYCMAGLNEEPLLPARWRWSISLSVTGIYTSKCWWWLSHSMHHKLT